MHWVKAAPPSVASNKLTLWCQVCSEACQRDPQVGDRMGDASYLSFPGGTRKNFKHCFNIILKFRMGSKKIN